MIFLRIVVFFLHNLYYFLSILLISVLKYCLRY